MSAHTNRRLGLFLIACIGLLFAPVLLADEPAAPENDSAKTFKIKQITTADELLQSLNESPRVFSQTKLSPEEVKKAAAALQKEFPFESIAPRLEYERKHFPDAEPAEAKADEKPGVLNRHAFFGTRSDALRMLHSNEVNDFINRNGFGFSRMPQPAPSHLYVPEPKPIPLAKVSVSADLTRESMVALPADEEALAIVRRGPAMPPFSRLKNASDNASMFFASPWTAGYVKDREHVAGFRPHAMEYMPSINPPEQPKPTNEQAAPKLKEAPSWKTTRLELVSLLKHEKPAVYVSDHLPLMDELKKAKVRPLNGFETKSLKSLKAGEEIVHESTTNRIRMLGAVRSTKQCNDCHYAPAGTLLGAFSYEFIRTPQLKPAVAKPAF